MKIGQVLDEGLFGRLPLPLAQLYRRAHNAKAVTERHHAAYYLWEASLKLLSSVVVVESMEKGLHDTGLAARLVNLERPALGHWWEFVWRLLPALARSDPPDPGFRRTRELLLGRPRDDLPRASGLDVELRRELGLGIESRSTVRVRDLFKRLVKYRNREFGHGAVGLRPDEFYERMGEALRAGIPEVLRYLDPLAGRRLVYIVDVRRQAAGHWLVEREELVGERGRRIESMELPDALTDSLPTPGRVYLLREKPLWENGGFLHALYPLIDYERDAGAFLFLNALRDSASAEYLCYSSGAMVRRCGPIVEAREPLASILRGLVGEGGGSTSGTRVQSPRPERPAPRSPRSMHRIGEYEIISQIGRGGMGVVYRAWQPSLERHVALKCLTSAGDAKVEERFSREIRALGRVEHPHLVKIFTSGSDGPNWFYTMELIEGAELASVCDHLAGAITSEVGEAEWLGALSSACLEARNREKSLSSGTRLAEGQPVTPPHGSSREQTPSGDKDGREQIRPDYTYIRHIVEIIRQVADAAHSLHRVGVIHRDIKPGNIMLTSDGLDAVLMDLGLAQLIDDAEGRLTRTCQFVGTLRYASPEQVQASETLDERADIYSLGATLWELLTLQPLFAAGEKTSPPELMRRIQLQDPEPVRHYNPRVPEDLEAIVLKCLDKDPDRRYPTADELSADLGRWLRGEAVYAKPPTLRYLLGKYLRRHRLRLGTAAFLLILVLAAAIAGVYRMDAALHTAKHALFDVSTSMGLEASQRGSLTEAALWFSHAASLASDDPEMLLGSMVRIRTWSLEIPRPLRAFLLEPDEILDLSFHHSGRYLLVSLSESGPRILDLVSGTRTSLAGAAGPASCAAWSPDGRRLALGTSRGVVEIHGFPDGGLLHSLSVSGSVASVKFSPDGGLLGVGGRSVRVWSCLEESFVTEDLWHSGVVRHLVFDKAGRHLATACKDGKARVYALDPPSGKARLLFDPVPHGLQSLDPGKMCPVFVEEGRGILTLSESSSLTWRDVATGEVLRELHLEDRAMLIRAVPSPDRRFIALCGWKQARLWDLRTGGPAGPPLRHLNDVETAVFSPDSRMLLTASRDRTARIWSVPSGEPLSPPLPHQGDVMGAAFSPDSIHFATSLTGSLVRVWSLPAVNAGDYLLPKEKGETFIRISPDGEHFLLSGTPRAFMSTSLTTQVYSFESKQPVGAVLDPGGVLLDAEFSPDGNRVVTFSSLSSRKYERHWTVYEPWNHPGRVQVWDWRTGKRLLGPLETASEPIGASYADNGKTLWVLCSGGQLQVFDVTTGAVLRELDHGETVAVPPPILRRAVQLSEDGRYVVTSGLGRTVQVWDARSFALRYAPLDTEGLVFDVGFSPDGRHLFAASQKGKVLVIDFSTGKTLAVLTHGDSVFAAAFSPDGSRLLAVCRDRTAHLWDWREEREICPEMSHEDQVLGAAFSRDGLWILTSTHASRFHVWEAKTGKPVAPPRRLLHVAPEVVVSPDGSGVILPTWGEAVHVFDLLDWIRDVPDNVSLADLRLYAELLSGRAVLEEGGAFNLTVEEWYKRWETLASTHPWFFQLDLSSDRRARWHRRRAARLEQCQEWDAALWHLGQLQALGTKVPARRLAALHRFVRSWRFASRVEPWVDTNGFVELTGEKLAEIEKSASGARLVRCRGPFVDFSRFLPGRDRYVAGYACRRIRTDRPQRVRVLAGSNDALRVWLNGECVHVFGDLRLAEPDQDEFLVDLPPGESTVLVEVSQAERSWGLYLRLEDENGGDLRLLDDGRLVPLPD